MQNFIVSPVHITAIKPGDTILHQGHQKTVCASDIKRSDFMGITIFGDSYKMGFMPVERFDFNKPA